MRILLVGEGAREHAVAERLAVGNELCAITSKPHPGILPLTQKHWISSYEPETIARCIQNEKFDLGFVSPDALLAKGLSDVLAAHGIPIASPTKAAARIEWDKGFMRTLMEKYKLPGQIRYVLAGSESEAQRAIQQFGAAAIKPLGLTSGKGVKVSGDHFSTEAGAMEYVREVLAKDRRVLIEEKLEGEEFSLQAFSDGKHIAVMPPVQDHKRALEGDQGPNTGGMGSYSTGKLLPFLKPSDIGEAIPILQAVVDAMKKEGAPFRGVLYGQFMAVHDGVRVVEFNARFADPESINVLALLETPLDEVLKQITEEKLKPVRFREECTVVKYLVPKGYPDSPVADSALTVDWSALSAINAKAYFASVYEKEGNIFTTRSRTVALLGTGATLLEAEEKSERACGAVGGALSHRRDIGTSSLIERRIAHMRQLRGTV